MKRQGLLLCFLILVVSFSPGADTFFIYLERSDSSPVDTTAPLSPNGAVSGMPVKEGLFDGLFDLNHIVFDDVRPNYRVHWKLAEFKELIDAAADGGAHYLVVARVTLLSAPFAEDLKRLESTVQYYCYEVKREVLVGRGELTRNNWGRESELNEEKLGLLLGRDLSVEIDRICSNYKNSTASGSWSETGH